MLKKLYGLFIYKLQYTSFFSIMQRVSGFLLLIVLYYFFLQEVLLNSFFYFNWNFYVKFFSNIFLFIIIFYFVFHLLNGLRIYIASLYYNYSLQKKALNLNLLYSLRIVEKNVFIKSFLNLIIGVISSIKNLIVKSNASFLMLIYILFFIIIFLIMV